MKLFDTGRLYWVHRSDVGMHNLKNLWKGIVKHMMGVPGRNLHQGWFYSPLISGVGRGVRSEVLLEQVQL